MQASCLSNRFDSVHWNTDLITKINKLYINLESFISPQWILCGIALTNIFYLSLICFTSIATRSRGHKETKISIRLILSQATKISAYSSQDSLVKMLLRNTFKLKTIILISIGQTFITGPNSSIDIK